MPSVKILPSGNNPLANAKLANILEKDFLKISEDLQKILLHLMEASDAIVNASNELIVAEETDRSNKLLTILVDSVALLGLSTFELNTLRRDLMKRKWLNHLRQLVKDLPSDSTSLFGDNIQKQIS